jgi:putative DNA primase/helicase
MDGIEVQLVPPGAEGQVRRAVKRFALVAAAGELATQQGLTGWPEGTATWGVKTCLDTWLQARGGAGNSERASMLRQVRMFFETQGEARFTWFHRAMDGHSAKTLNRAGFRMLIDSTGANVKTNNQHQAMYGEGTPTESLEDASSEFYVLTEVFKTEVCKGFDHEAVCRLLLELGCLTTSESEPGRFSMKAKLPGMGAGGVRYYRVTAKVFELNV